MADQIENSHHLAEYVYLKVKGKFPPGMSRPLSSSYHFDDVMVAVLPMDLFISEHHLPDCFRLVGDQVYSDAKRINVYVHSSRYQPRFPYSNGGVLKVTSLEDLDAVSASLLSKPMLLDVEWKWRHATNGFDHVSIEYSVVVINTSHRLIRVQLEEGFKEARNFLNEGKKFSIEFDFTPMVVKWYTALLREMEGTSECCGDGSDDTTGRYGRLCITNNTKHWSCYRCNSQMCPYWCLCLPCCLFTWPCYETHRNLTCTDICFEMTGDVVFLEEVWDSFSCRFLIQQPMEALEEG